MPNEPAAEPQVEPIPPHGITVGWLLHNLPVSHWVTCCCLLAGAFGIGIKAASFPWVVQALSEKPQATAVETWNSKAVFEGERRVVTATPRDFNLHVRDVSIARQELKLEVGPDGEGFREVTLRPNVPKDEAVGGIVYRFTAVDLARASVGADIAVLSIKAVAAP